MKDAAALSPLGRVAIVGMGYVGTVAAAKLAHRGWAVIGVESNPIKLSWLRSGQCPIRETDLAPLLAEAFDSGRFDVTDNLHRAVQTADVMMICVGTPADPSGRADLSVIRRVISQTAASIRKLPQPPLVLIRSTVPPGTCEEWIVPTLRSAHPGTVVAHHPEFLREGSALADWDHPALIVFGADPRDRSLVESWRAKLYGDLDAPVIHCRWSESELIKLACNAFHAVKITFANEIGALAQNCGADGATVMAALCKDVRLNLSPAYLKAGFCFGGSCLPKDTRSLQSRAADLGLHLPLIESVLDSNRTHLDRWVQRILAQGRQPTLLVGLSFKAGTDDLRHSPMVELAERLLGKGVPLTIFDPDLQPQFLVGTNAAYIHQHLPHLNLLMGKDLYTSLAGVKRVLLAKPVPDLDGACLEGKLVVDLTGSGSWTPAAADRLANELPNFSPPSHAPASDAPRLAA